MNIRRFRALHAAGASFAEIARECGCDWRTVRKYLAEDAPSVPPVAPSRAGCQPRVITPFVGVIESWLRKDITLKGTVIHERLVAEHGFTGNYQRTKMFLAEARPRIAAELGVVDENPLTGLHRRFEVVPGAQAQVDWGDEGDLLAHVGIPNVYSFHLTLSHSRDPFSCFTSSMDLATFWDCHRRAFAHFGGVPGSIVYDRTKTVIRRHVAPRAAVPLHPEAAAFADHYGFVIDVLAAYRPTGKGRVERQVEIVRSHVIAGRSFDSLAELDGHSLPGCRSAAPRCTAPTARSSACAPKPTGPRWARYRPTRIWSPTNTCAESGKTAWSVSRPASTPSRPAWSGPGNGSRCRSTQTPVAVRRVTWSPSPHCPLTAAACWPPILAPHNAAVGRSTRPTGTACRTDIPAPPPATPSPGPESDQLR